MADQRKVRDTHEKAAATARNLVPWAVVGIVHQMAARRPAQRVGDRRGRRWAAGPPGMRRLPGRRARR